MRIELVGEMDGNTQFPSLENKIILVPKDYENFDHSYNLMVDRE